MNKATLFKWKLTEFFGKFGVIMFVVSGGALLTIHNRPLYQFVLHRENLGARVGLTNDVVLKNYDLLMDFMNNPFKQELSLPNFPFSPSGEQHMVEVRVLFIFAMVMFVISAVLAVWYWLKMRKEKTFWKLINLAKVSMVVPIVLGFLSIFMFDEFFVWFHELFFNNDYWLFDARTDPIILVLPESYFLLTFVFFFLVIEIVFFLLYWKGKRALK